VSGRLDPIEGVRPAPVGPVRPIVLTPAERDAERRRRERARAARRAAETPPDDAPRGDDEPPHRLDVRG
jgi:hypothetical protein